MMDYKITRDGRKLKRVDLAMDMRDYTRDWHPKYGFERRDYNENCWRAIMIRMTHDPKHQRLFEQCEGDITWRRDEMDDIATGSTIRRLQASFYIDEAQYLIHLLGQ